MGIDNSQAGSLVAEHLWNAGIRAPGILSPLEGSPATRERAEGFRARYASFGLDPAAIPEWQAPGLAHVEVGYHAARAIGLRAAWPEGLLCVSGQVAYGAFRAAREAQLRVPQDCRLVGIDGSSLNPWLAPWLESVRVPYERFGPVILDQLQRIWSGAEPAERLLPHGPVA
mgnify:CR=1 FL=1